MVDWCVLLFSCKSKLNTGPTYRSIVFVCPFVFPFEFVFKFVFVPKFVFELYLQNEQSHIACLGFLLRSANGQSQATHVSFSSDLQIGKLSRVEKSKIPDARTNMQK